MPQERTFHAPNVDPVGLAEALARWLGNRDFETQVLPVEEGGTVIQGRQTEGWKSLLGMSLATNIVVSQSGTSIRVEVGQGKWMDKAVVGAVGLLILWPALVPAAIGAWKQSQLPEEIFEQVSRYVARHASEPFSAAPPVNAPLPVPVIPTSEPEPVEVDAATLPCPSCGQAVRVGARHCENCGQAMPEESISAGRFCEGCGAELSAAAKFCSECGASAPQG